MPTNGEKLVAVEEQVKQLIIARAFENATREREGDRIYLRFDDIDKRLRHLETRIAQAAGGIMVLQTLITVAIKLFWPGHY